MIECMNQKKKLAPDPRSLNPAASLILIGHKDKVLMYEVLTAILLITLALDGNG